MVERLHRTQVYLPAELNRALDDLARQRGVTKADLIRRASKRLVEEETPLEADPIWGIVGIGKGPAAHVAREHDRYLVDEEIKRWKRPAG